MSQPEKGQMMKKTKPNRGMPNFGKSPPLNKVNPLTGNGQVGAFGKCPITSSIYHPSAALIVERIKVISEEGATKKQRSVPDGKEVANFPVMFSIAT